MIIRVLLLSFFLCSCTPIETIKSIFKRSDGEVEYSAHRASQWVDKSVSAPDSSCSAMTLHASEVKVLPGTGGEWKKEWTESLISAMDHAPYNKVLEGGVFSDTYMREIGCETFNSRLNVEQKKRVIIQHLAEMCRPESNYNGKLTYSECEGENCWTNYGLCQMTPETVNLPAYGCNVTKEDLLDPIKNLKCAILVLNENMRNRCAGRFPCPNGTVAGKVGTYWGPMRRSEQAEVAKAKMKAQNEKVHPYCSSENWQGMSNQVVSRVGQKSGEMSHNCQPVRDSSRHRAKDSINDSVEIDSSDHSARDI